MIFFVVCLTVGISAVASLDAKDCKDKATFNFKQGCFDCLCRNGKAICSNTANFAPSGLCNWSDDDYDEDTSASDTGMNPASRIKPWDLDYPRRTEGDLSPQRNFHNYRPAPFVKGPPVQHYQPYPLVYQRYPPVYAYGPDRRYPLFWGRKMRYSHNRKMRKRLNKDNTGSSIIVLRRKP